MAGLLVSVRDAREAGLLQGLGVPLIDVKDPAAGPLGAADPTVLDQVAQILGPESTLSAAMGELKDWEGALPLADYSYLKWGLSRLRGQTLRQNMAAAFADTIDAGQNPVAVAYADWQQAECPPPLEVLELGASLGARALLVDTYTKQGLGLFDYLSEEELASLRHRASGLGLGLALAGSLNFSSLPRVLGIQPDWVAVRGGVCERGRLGTIVPEKVKAWMDFLNPDHPMPSS